MKVKIIKPLENWGKLIDGVTGTVKDEIKKTREWIFNSLLEPMAASLTACVAFSLLGSIFGKGVTRAGRGFRRAGRG